MTDTRANKVKMIAERIPDQEVMGPAKGDVAGCIVGRNIRCMPHGGAAVPERWAHSVAHAHIRYT